MCDVCVTGVDVAGDDDRGGLDGGCGGPWAVGVGVGGVGVGSDMVSGVW